MIVEETFDWLNFADLFLYAIKNIIIFYRLFVCVLESFLMVTFNGKRFPYFLYNL